MMKKILISMLILLGVTASAQTPKIIVVKTYKQGQVIAQRVLTLPKSEIKVVSKDKIVTKIKTVKVPVDRIVYQELIKHDTIRVPVTVEKIVEKQVIKNIPYEVEIEKIVTKTVQAPATRDIFIGPNVIVTNRNTVHGLGLSALLKNKHNEIFQLSAGMMMRDGLTTPTPYVSLGAFFKIK